MFLPGCGLNAPPPLKPIKFNGLCGVLRELELNQNTVFGDGTSRRWRRLDEAIRKGPTLIEKWVCKESGRIWLGHPVTTWCTALPGDFVGSPHQQKGPPWVQLHHPGPEAASTLELKAKLIPTLQMSPSVMSHSDRKQTETSHFSNPSNSRQGWVADGVSILLPCAVPCFPPVSFSLNSFNLLPPVGQHCLLLTDLQDNKTLPSYLQQKVKMRRQPQKSVVSFVCNKGTCSLINKADQVL